MDVDFDEEFTRDTVRMLKSGHVTALGRTDLSVGDYVAAGSTGDPVTTDSTVDPIRLRYGITRKDYLATAEEISDLLAKPLEQRDQIF